MGLLSRGCFFFSATTILAYTAAIRMDLMNSMTAATVKEQPCTHSLVISHCKLMQTRGVQIAGQASDAQLEGSEIIKMKLH